MDLRLPDGPGEQVLDAIEYLSWPQPEVFVVTGDYDSSRWLALHKRNCRALPKPVDGATLLDAFGWLLSEVDPVAAFAPKYRLGPRETALSRVGNDRKEGIG